MRRDAPFRLLAGTVAFLILVNLLAAQLIVQTFYPGAGLRLGAAVLAALAFAALVCLVLTVLGWRAYLRRPPDA